MKSLSEIVETMPSPTAQKNSVALPMRPAPLSPEEILKIQSAIEKNFIIKKEEVYGYIPVMENGETVRNEFDVTGEVVKYSPRANVPIILWEAILRPAPRNHVLYHLARLAAHRRDTRGAEALQVVMEDISADLKDVSEWAVIMACAEMRRKNSTWFPNTGEIIEIIEKYSVMLENLYIKRIDSVKPEGSKPQETRRAPLQREEGSDAGKARRAELEEFLKSKGDTEDYSNTRTISNYRLEGLARSKYGWRGYAAEQPPVS